MGGDALALGREFVERYNARDIQGLERICHPELEARSIYAGIDSGGVFRGREGFPHAYFREVDKVWEFFQLLDPVYEVSGDVVLISCEMWDRGAQSGAEFRSRIYVVWKIREGRLWLEETLTDEREARDVVARWTAG